LGALVLEIFNLASLPLVMLCLHNNTLWGFWLVKKMRWLQL
jgi:hypothetical protein